jgi:hypothetical protein
MDTNLTESQRVLQERNTSETVQDILGRNIELRKLGRREIMRHMRLWGPACNVEQWMALALMAASCRSIDGVPIPATDTPDRVEMVADMLGQEGLDAIGKWYQDQAAPELGDIRSQAKNL